MTTTTKIDREALTSERDNLWRREIATASNAGTYGAREACDAVGSGDPAYADYTLYERVGDGRLRSTGPSQDRAPGVIRRFGGAEMRAARTRLAEIDRQLGGRR